MNQITQLFRKLTDSQRIWIAAIGHRGHRRLLRASRTGIRSAISSRSFPAWPRKTPDRMLAKLREVGAEYRLDDNGSTILVPSGKVAELRLEMASAGLPKSGRIGFELFDKANFGASEFAEQVNYHRAIEGELERSRDVDSRSGAGAGAHHAGQGFAVHRAARSRPKPACW